MLFLEREAVEVETKNKENKVAEKKSKENESGENARHKLTHSLVAISNSQD